MAHASRRQVFHAYENDGASRSDDFRFCPRCAAAGQANGLRHFLCRTCGYAQYRNPAPGVAVVVVQDEHVLLGRRSPRSHLGGRWAFPAGFIEFDEDFLSAARREAKEETGLDVEVTGILNVTSNYLTHRLHAVVIAVAAQPIAGTLIAGDDLCELRWVPCAGPFPPLAYEADADLLRVLQVGVMPLLPVDARYAKPLRSTNS